MCREFVLGRRRTPPQANTPSSYGEYTNLNSVLKVDYAGPPPPSPFPISGAFRLRARPRRYFCLAYYQLSDQRRPEWELRNFWTFTYGRNFLP